MKKYGFVYIWRDKKHNRYYVGSHWGTEDDGYVCSSTNMRNNYRNRPDDFKRRIIARVYTNREDLLHEEDRWLKMISKEKFGSKYYNVNGKAHGYYWWVNEETKKIVGQKLSNNPTRGQNISKAKKGKIPVFTDLKERSERTKQEWAEGKHQTNHLKGENRTEAQKEGNRLQAKAMKGRKNPAQADVIKRTMAGARWYTNGTINKRVKQQPQGFWLGRI